MSASGVWIFFEKSLSDDQRQRSGGTARSILGPSAHFLIYSIKNWTTSISQLPFFLKRYIVAVCVIPFLTASWWLPYVIGIKSLLVSRSARLCSLQPLLASAYAFLSLPHSQCSRHKFFYSRNVFSQGLYTYCFLCLKCLSLDLSWNGTSFTKVSITTDCVYSNIPPS